MAHNKESFQIARGENIECPFCPIKVFLTPRLMRIHFQKILGISLKTKPLELPMVIEVRAE